ncbi:two-component system OmpR family response regulator [Azonexus fungiphilus]|jgi:two-component system OmpR family response regulator|uniref:Two-component system OmpR family response regulator n=1 Tax=Azonexus fungiphilus TaxID=146940 RepID=A0A495WEA5_9RHOO|nr:response regulator transcription factor [Azonexus fungiphilus]NHC06207.1 response regulator transcription factor [Azonexus fungiphilus]RKT59534.1 two-component system OmpR family response regulator [Azonexus fungiphilus]
MHLLVVEDEPTLNLQIARSLRAEGYVVDVAVNGRDALHLGNEESFDAVVLDLGLPQLDGLSVLREWRAAGRAMPVLILTARGDWHERVTGIDAGADDYLVKPFHMEELSARLRALIRRAAGQAGNELRNGPLSLDLRSARVCLDGQPLTLTSHEFRVLACLLRQRGEVVSRATLAEHVYPLDAERDSNTLEVFVGRLRKKLPEGMIETLRGLGYRLRAEP